MESVLIVDDNADMQFFLSNILKEEGYDVVLAADGSSALREVKKRHLDLVLLDIKLPGMNGIEVLEKMKVLDKDLTVIMMTAYGDIRDSVRAMKLGAYDYVTKPFESDELILVIKKALKTQYLDKEVKRLRKRLGEQEIVEEFKGETPQIKRVIEQIKIVAPTDMTLIIQGESGTGKDLVANMVHRMSPRANKPFIVIDCGAIPETLVESELFGYEKGAFSGANCLKEGLFEQANGGTFFFDEISNLPAVAQAKLLRAIQEKKIHHLGGTKHIEVDVRIVAATNTVLSETVKKGKFREDLFHRLNEFIIVLPPLRERSSDLSILAKHFLNEASQEFNKKIKGFSPRAIKSLLDHSWPGNVRELKNVIKRAVLLTGSEYIEEAELLLTDDLAIGQSEVPKEQEEELPLRKRMQKATKEIEKKIIERALKKAGGNKTKAAKMLKVTRATLYTKMKEFGLDKAYSNYLNE